MYDRQDVKVTTSTGTVTEVNAACGIVGFAPCSSCQYKAANSPYSFRFHIRDVNGLVVFFPNDDPILIKVRSV